MTPSVISLKGSAAFDDLFRRCRKIRTPLLHLHVQFESIRPVQSLETGETRETVRSDSASGVQPLTHVTRLGIVVRKKVVRRAVDRARIKRWMREVFRRCALEHPEALMSVKTVIVVWQAPYAVHSHDVSFASVYAAVLRGLQRASDERVR